MKVREKEAAPDREPAATTTAASPELAQKLIAAAHEAIRAGRSAAGEAFAALAGEDWSTSVPTRKRDLGRQSQEG